MRRIERVTGAWVGGALLCLAAAQSHALDTLSEAIAGGKAHLQLRLRYEQVDVDNPALADADARTLRTRLGYQTGTWHGLSALVEFEDVRNLPQGDRYAPAQPGYAVVADPEVTELNQAWLQYGWRSDDLSAQLRYGRQRLILDDARFVGNVGWRQNEQTFDATRAELGFGEFELVLAYVHAVHGITPAFDARSSHKLANLRWKAAPLGQLTLYAYYLDDDSAVADTDTLGIRYLLSYEISDIKLSLHLEYAEQDTDDFSVNYYRIASGAAFQQLTLTLGREVLGSDGGDYGMQTPLATKHAFNGWADQFLNTPNTGLTDDMLRIGANYFGLNILAAAHRYSADSGSARYGKEYNLQVTRAFGRHYSLGAKAADYRADDLGVDTRKVWVWAEANF